MTACSEASLASQRRVDFASCSRHVRTSCWRVLVVVLLPTLANVCAASRVHAEDGIRVPFAERDFVITEQQFDQMVFGAKPVGVVRVIDGIKQVEMVVPSTAEMDFRKRMQANLAAEIQAVDRRVPLTEAQKKKLRLAGQGDVVLFLGRVADLRRKVTPKSLNRQQYNEFMSELQPLRVTQELRLTGETSLFRKTLRTVLTDEQRVRFQTIERDRQAAIIHGAMKLWEANGLKLTDETRQKVAELIVEHGRVPQTVGPYGQFIVLLEANALAERLKPLLTEAEWGRFEGQVRHAKGHVLEIESSGLWTVRRSEDDDEASADATGDRR